MTEKCHYCEHEYEIPVSLHHSEAECKANLEFAATEICPTCQGEGWLHPPLGDGDICPTCDGGPAIIGGTGRVPTSGGA